MTRITLTKVLLHLYTQMRNYLCERKYDNDDRTYMDDTFDYIKSIKWHWDMSEEDHKRS